MGAPKGFSLRRSWHKSALRNRFVTDVVCSKMFSFGCTTGEIATFSTTSVTSVRTGDTFSSRRRLGHCRARWFFDTLSTIFGYDPKMVLYFLSGQVGFLNLVYNVSLNDKSMAAIFQRSYQFFFVMNPMGE